MNSGNGRTGEIRRKHIAVRTGVVVPTTDPAYIFRTGEHILAAGSKKNLLAMIDKVCR